MPDQTLRIVADLHLEVGDDRGHTTGHLSSEPGGLVLDVDDPAVLLRSVPGRGFVRDLPVKMPAELVDGVSFQLRSRGHDLGRVRLSATGKVRLRPTAAGVLVAGRTAVSYGRTRAVVWTALAAVAGLTVASALRRRRQH